MFDWHVCDQLSQLYPPKPTFTETDLPDLAGKVYVVTGANTGVGKELAQILYSKNARVYVAARSEDKANSAMQAIKTAVPESQGHLDFMSLDLADLSKIPASAEYFFSKETKLHGLFNNAGVMNPASGSKTAQDYELQLGVNNVGTFMLTKLLTPALVATTKSEGPGSARVIWVASSAAEAPLVPTGGVNMDTIDKRSSALNWTCYALSKSGNVLHAIEYAKRYREQGIISIPLNPGNLNSELWRTQGAIAIRFLRTLFLHPPIYGAYTELFAGFSPEITLEKSGQWGKSPSHTSSPRKFWKLILLLQLGLGVASRSCAKTYRWLPSPKRREDTGQPKPSGNGARSRSNRSWARKSRRDCEGYLFESWPAGRSKVSGAEASRQASRHI